MEIYFFMILILGALLFIAWKLSSQSQDNVSGQIKLSVSEGIREIKEDQNKNNIAQVEKLGNIEKAVNDELHRFKQDIGRISEEQINQTRENLRENFLKLHEQVDKRLDAINEKVEQKLSKGFEDTNKTFTSIIERLGKIDEAQKKIETLSKDVVSLSDILSDKKSRGAFGEIQLHQILASVFGEKNDAVYQLQKSLSGPGGRVGIVDAVVYLPPPTGILPIDSKFPLENYRRVHDTTLGEDERNEASKQFKNDLKARIDETSKYVIDGVTAEYSIMFVTAEAIFAEIHAYHPKAIEYAHQKKVYIASPTTLFAMMNTVQSVLRDVERSKQAQVIREHLNNLKDEFDRYRTRWDKLAQHLGQVGKDVDDINITTKKISEKFDKINNAELPVESKVKSIE